MPATEANKRDLLAAILCRTREHDGDLAGFSGMTQQR
jgi:hypothetical protein